MPTYAYYAAGLNDQYNLGLSDNTNRTSFTALPGIWKKIRYSWMDTEKFAIGIKADGTLWGWGSNAYRQLGGLPNASYTAPTQIGTDTDWDDVALGAIHTILRKTNGTIWGCGYNASGQIGLGHTTSPVTTITQIGSATDWAEIHAAAYSSFGLKTSGALYGWGSNSGGALGLGHTTATVSTPTQEVTASTWATFSTGGYFSAAIKADGTLWGWGGYNRNGTSAANVSTPTQIGSATNWLKLAHGYQSGHAIKTDGTLWSWGIGTLYVLGTGSTATQIAPVQIGSATNWSQIAAGGNTLLALNNTGALYGCGNNTYGALGNGSTGTVTTLTAITPTVTPDQLAGSGYYSMLIGEEAVETASASAPIRIVVTGKAGSATAPISIRVTQTGSATAPISIRVIESNPAQLLRWSARVMVAGDNLSARLTGAIQVDAEEGAVRTAVFQLVAENGPLSTDDLLSNAVSIHFQQYVAGDLDVEIPMFSGYVERVDIDIRSAVLTVRCQDDYKNRVANLTTAQIDLLTANELALPYSPGALGDAPDDRWDYAQARMECVSGIMDASISGAIRVTPFAGSTDFGVFDESRILDQSLSVELPQRSDIINRVDIEYEYRQYRCRERRAWISWSNSIIGGTDAYASGYQSPSMDAVKSAVDGCGWKVLSASYQYGYQYVKTSAPSGYAENNDWWVVGTEYACGSMTAALGQRHAQPFTERHIIPVNGPALSISVFGTRAQTLRGALESDWEPGNWESDWSQTTPDANAGEIDYAGNNTRAVSDAAIQTLLMMAKRIILASHRTARVHFSAPCLANIDLIHRVEIDTAMLAATGKVAQIVHTLDLDSGAATTDVSLAIHGVSAWGAASDTTLSDLPDPPEWGNDTIDDAWVTDEWIPEIKHLDRHVGAVTNHLYSDNLFGYLVNAPAKISVINFTTGQIVSIDNPYYDAEFIYPQTGFKVGLPGVAESYRQSITVDSEYPARTALVSTSNPITLIIGA